MKKFDTEELEIGLPEVSKISHQFDRDIVSLMESIGFTFYKSSTHFGRLSISYEYKYYPSYFDGKHYTLLLFCNICSYKRDLSSLDKSTVDHRLYIHKNLDGSFYSSPYQIDSSSEDNQKRIIEKINKIFSLELRDKKLNELIYEKN